MTDDLTKDRWFAGFVDGEGCFGIHRGKARYGSAFHPELSIALRADDLAILEQIQAAFGGGLSISRPPGAAPLAKVCIGSKRDLPRLVEYFDRFPLRAKKAADYVLWRRAVLLYCSAGGGRKQGAGDELEALRDALMGSRRYDEAAAAVRPRAQLSLVEDVA